MKKLALLTFALLAPALARAGFSTDNLTATKSFTAPYGSTTPASQCTSNADRGKIFVDTAAPSGQQIYECEGTGGWKLQGGTGGGALVAIDTGTVNQLPLNRLAAGTLPSNITVSSSSVVSGSTNYAQINPGSQQSGSINVAGATLGGTTIGSNVAIVGDYGTTGRAIVIQSTTPYNASNTTTLVVQQNQDIGNMTDAGGVRFGWDNVGGTQDGDIAIMQGVDNGVNMTVFAPRLRIWRNNTARYIDFGSANAIDGGPVTNTNPILRSIGLSGPVELTTTGGKLVPGSIGTGSLPSDVIATSVTASGVSAASYGSASQVGTFTVGADGRLTAAASTSISITSSQAGLGNVQNVDQTIASNLTSGLIPNARHDASSVTLRGQTPLVVSTNGVVVGSINTLNLKPGTNVTMTAAMWVSSCDVTVNSTASGGTPQDFNLADGTGTLSGSKVSGGTFGAVNGSALTSLSPGNLTAGAATHNVMVDSVSASGVTAGTYGSATQVSSVTIGQDGRVTSATNIAIAISGSSVSGGTFGAVNGSALTNLSGANVGSGIPAANIAAGSLGPLVIASSHNATGVTAGTYGSATQVSSITVAGDGRITSATNVAIAISGNAVSGGTFGAVNGSALTNLTAANISGGVLGNTVQVSSLAAVVTAGSYGSTTIIPTIIINAQGQVIGLSSNTAAAGAAGPFTNAVSSTNLSMGGFSLNMGTAPVLNVTSMSVAGTYNASNVPWSFIPYFYARVGNPDQSFVANNSTVTPTGFTFWAPANSTITGHVQLQLNSSSSNSGGFKFHMTGPASPVAFELRGGGTAGSATAFNKSQSATSFSVDTVTALCTVTSGVCEETFDYGIVTGATAGNVSFNILAVGVLTGNNFVEHESWMDAHLQ